MTKLTIMEEKAGLVRGARDKREKRKKQFTGWVKVMVVLVSFFHRMDWLDD
jgi:hypothetical protein